MPQVLKRIGFLVLIGLLAAAARPIQAQTATTATFSITGEPMAGILQAGDGNFYSISVPIGIACKSDATMLCSYIYKITPAGNTSVFYPFQPVLAAASSFTNSDGFMPVALIVGTDGNLYGACLYGGPGGGGTIFKLTGGVLSVVKSFSTSDPGFSPNSLIEGADGNFYFTNINGVYQLTPAGAVTTVFSFPSDNSQGNNATSLMQGSDNNFYVTLDKTPGPVGAPGGDVGAIVQISPGGQWSLVHSFAPDASEGKIRGGPLAQGKDGTLFGVTKSLSNTIGTVFQVSPSGAFTLVHTFPGVIVGSWNSALFLGSDGNFYGVTLQGGDTTSANCTILPTAGCGTVYQVTPSGTFSILHNFEGGRATSFVVADNPKVDGGGPTSPLVQGSGGIFYGTADGVGGTQTAFSLTMNPAVPPPVQLTINPTQILLGQTVDLSWRVLNAFSLTAQQCGAYVQGASSGAGNWSGVQQGAFANGVYSGSTTIKPTASGSYTYALTCGGKESGFVTLKVKGPLNVPAPLPDGLVGTSYAIPSDEFEGVPPYVTTVTSGALPPGMSIDPSTGVLTGTPQQFGTYTFGLQVVDSDSPQSKVTGFTTLTVKPSLAIANGIVLKGQVGAKFSYTLPATGGIKPYVWSISSYIPDGITLDPAKGILSGTPTTATPTPTPTITIQVKDSESTPDKTTVNLPFLILPPAPIAAVEFTQSIQVYQGLEDLKTALLTNGEPPMPIISGKLAVMRVYFTAVDTATTVSLQVGGVVSQTKTIDLQPDCEPSDQRSHNNSCPSVDFYFTPPSGPWVADLVLSDTAGNQLQHETLTVTSRDTAGIHLLGTSVCDSKSGLLSWNCGDPTLLIGRTELLARMMPTNSVTLDMTTDRITNEVFPTGRSAARYDAWLHLSVAQLGALYNSNLVTNQAADLAANTYSLRFGIYRHNLDSSSINYDTGLADAIPGRAAMSSDFTERLGVDASASVVTHETGHTLGLKHTNIQGPASTAPPGCYNLAEDSSTDWHPMVTNNVQSSIQYEYPFDVSTGAVLDPNSTYELMSYCFPRWISPQRYDTVTQTLRGGTPLGIQLRNSVQADATQLAHPALSPPVIGPYWLVSGAIQSTGVVFDPIFQDTLNGTSDPGAGTYSIEEQNSSGQALYTRYFTPVGSGTDIATGPDLVFAETFAESIPVNLGTTSLVVKDSTGTPIGNVAITGTAPTVSIISPAAGFSASGLQTVSWTTNSPSSALTSRVLYSSNSGATWSEMGEVADDGLNIDFGSLPGTNGATALIKVLVTDGVNTGSATSIPFSVGRKVPTIVQILSPAANFVHAAADPLLLIGSAYDPDDGMLHGASLAWTSDIQGTLGTGSPLSVSLFPGTHNLTLTATDSDGNSKSTSVSVSISGARPSLALTTATNSSNCVNATIAANSGVNGANLTLVQYSVNGGANYVGIPIGNLPFTLTVPGTGSVNFVARAYDASGQSAAQSTVVSIPTTCTQAVKANPVITWSSPAALTYGTPLGGTQLNASSSVPGTFSYSPSAGTVPAAGSQTLSVTFTPTDNVNFAVVTSTTTLVVSPAPLTITPVSGTRPYGSSNPAFTYGATGFVNGDSSSALSGVPALATTATTLSAPGNYPIIATTGTLTAANYSFVFASGTLAVTRAASSAALQASAAALILGSPETLTVTITSSTTTTPTGNVTFLSGTTMLGSSTVNSSGAATFAVNLAVGINSVTAQYSGDLDFSPSISGAVIVTVASASTATVVSSSATPANLGSTITFTATVSPSINLGAPTGTVTFKDGTTALSTGTLNNSGTATYNTAALIAGTHTITAVYSGDGNYLGSTSNGLAQAVNAPGYGLSVTPAALTITGGGTGQTTFTVTPVGGFKSPITFACSGLPAYATCTFSPSSLTPDGTNSAITSTLTIATSVKSASASSSQLPGSHPDRYQKLSLAMILFGLPGLILVRWKFVKHWGAGYLIAVFGFLLGLVSIAIQGCGGSDTNTPRGTDTITVTASSSGATQTASFTLTVQ